MPDVILVLNAGSSSIKFSVFEHTAHEPTLVFGGQIEGLYTAKALVTGQRAETRDPALRQAFRDVLVKVSGDGALFSDADAERLFEPDLVRAYSYRDLMAALPKKDEQGTRDRPFELTVEFVPEKIDNTLAKLGRAPWGPGRPTVTSGWPTSSRCGTETCCESGCKFPPAFTPRWGWLVATGASASCVPSRPPAKRHRSTTLAKRRKRRR